MKIGPLTLPTFNSPAKIGVVVALVLALSASGGFGALFFGAGGGASAPIEKGDTGGVPTAVPGDSAITGDRIDVVRTGTFSLEVEDVDGSLAKLTNVVKSQGGYVSGSYRYTDTSTPYFTVTFRVPAASFDAAVLALRAEGTVLSEQISTYEVTMQLVDLEARLRNLRASEAALLELMTRATTVSDVLAVQTQLTSVRSDIESYDAQRASLADQVAMTTVSVTISPIGSSIGNATSGFDLGEEGHHCGDQPGRRGLADRTSWRACGRPARSSSYATLRTAAPTDGRWGGNEANGTSPLAREQSTN